jgi:hypothetical protein
MAFTWSTKSAPKIRSRSRSRYRGAHPRETLRAIVERSTPLWDALSLRNARSVGARAPAPDTPIGSGTEPSARRRSPRTPYSSRDCRGTSSRSGTVGSSGEPCVYLRWFHRSRCRPSAVRRRCVERPSGGRRQNAADLPEVGFDDARGARHIIDHFGAQQDLQVLLRPVGRRLRG